MKFQPTADQILEISAITTEMLQNSNLPREFIAQVDSIARAWEGVYDLMVLWRNAPAGTDREEIEADLNEIVDDITDAPPEPAKKPYIPFDELTNVAGQVLAFKKKLRTLIDQHGGVTEVARKSGIPQPSLSRMLNSHSMPRRTTLYKLADAMGVAETEVVTDWVR